MTPPAVVPTPRFLTGSAGPLFSLILGPEGPPTRQAALYLPAIGEEMNRSRRMAALLGRALAEHGCTTLVLDPFGTGDSAGDFSEARWQTWLDDCRSALDWLSSQGHHRIHLIGLRGGANLALSASAQGAPDLAGLVLWQPLLSGKLFLNQWLRIRVAGNLGSAEQDQETTGSLRARLRDGETLEVAGYALTPALADDIEGLDLVEAAKNVEPPLLWLELAGDATAEPPPASARALQALAEAGREIAYERIQGEPFWSIEEPVLIDALIARTVTQLCGSEA